MAILAVSAGELLVMPVTRAPCGRGRPSCAAASGPKRRIEPHAQIGPHDRAVLDELVGDDHHHVDRNREADAFVAAAGAGDGRVDADHFAAEVEQRAAAVAGVDGGIGLQEVLELTPSSPSSRSRRPLALMMP